ncbi:hypothetical protein [Thioflexithrix psekupsensis]|uniref:Uncharacterized protein n=1 Tax=Thioflexithrix psekupsensis TaxID=1570016 RepID=A0A251X3F7_9GAMM|nr:hypothetical protein [Thioflexithrix psekupsensis]OUD12024.1 hypothetical protein TPSD3_12875 [Thioflexithrix psekupsensis]
MSAQMFTIAHVELTPTDLSVLKVAVGLVNGRSDVKAQVLEPAAPAFASANVFLVDMDFEAGRAFYQQFQYGRQRVMLLLSTETVNDQRNPTLKKTIRVQTLKDVLVDLYEEMFVKNQVGAFKKSDANDSASVPTNPPPVRKTSEMLFFLLWELKQKRQVAQIFCPPHSPLFVNAQQEIIASSASRDTLRKMTHGESGAVRSTAISDSDFNVLARGQLIIPLSQVLWSAALYGSAGILLPGHQLDTPVQMTAWPNLSRLEFNAEHMCLASLMTSQALTLRQVQAKSGFSLETVIGFYNACAASGLIAVKPTHLPVPALQVKAPIKQNLLSKIAQRLKLSVPSN